MTSVVPRDGGDLCQQTPSSGQFLACPAAKDCVPLPQRFWTWLRKQVGTFLAFNFKLLQFLRGMLFALNKVIKVCQLIKVYYICIRIRMPSGQYIALVSSTDHTHSQVKQVQLPSHPWKIRTLYSQHHQPPNLEINRTRPPARVFLPISQGCLTQKPSSPLQAGSNVAGPGGALPSGWLLGWPFGSSGAINIWAVTSWRWLFAVYRGLYCPVVL